MAAPVGIVPSSGQNPDSIMAAAGSLKPPATNSRVARFAARFPESSVNGICGALSGVASGLVTCPLDVIKTRLQAQGSFRARAAGVNGMPVPAYRGLIPTATLIWTQDGLRGMYRGLSPMLIGYLPTWAVYMSVYGAAKEAYYPHFDRQWVAQGFAAVTAGACSTLTTNPIWVIKTRLMSQVGSAASKDTRTPWHYKGTMDAFRQMYRAEGMGVFYSGLAPALLGLSHVAIQFPLYEYFKFRFTGLEMGESNPSNNSWDQWVAIPAATFLSKCVATSATYPHEVLRTRLQTQQRHPIASRKHHGPLRSHGASLPTGQVPPTEEVKSNLPRYKGVITTCRTILKEEGWRAFYYGMGTNLFRAVPSAMTTIMTYEMLKKAFTTLQEEGRREANAGLE